MRDDRYGKELKKQRKRLWRQFRMVLLWTFVGYFIFFTSTMIGYFLGGLLVGAMSTVLLWIFSNWNDFYYPWLKRVHIADYKKRKGIK